MKTCVLAAAMALVPACFGAQARVAIAYVDHKAIIVADDSGAVIRNVPLNFEKQISGLAVDATGSQIVVILPTFGRGEFGGDLYLWRVNSPKWRKITVGPYVFKQQEEGHREVYDSPSFSPDGKTLAFIVHTESLYDDNDCVMAAGPVATIDLNGGKVRVVKTTTNIEQTLRATQDPPFCTASVSWSPDGKRLLEGFETGFGVVNLTTLGFRLWDPPLEKSYRTYSINWLDGTHVLFAYRETEDAKPTLRQLSLRTGAVSDPPARLRVAGQVIDFNKQVFVTENDGVREVHGLKVWKLPEPKLFSLAPESNN